MLHFLFAIVSQIMPGAACPLPPSTSLVTVPSFTFTMTILHGWVMTTAYKSGRQLLGSYQPAWSWKINSGLNSSVVWNVECFPMANYPGSCLSRAPTSLLHSPSHVQNRKCSSRVHGTEQRFSMKANAGPVGRGWGWSGGGGRGSWEPDILMDEFGFAVRNA